jgi:hypothetical protein
MVLVEGGMLSSLPGRVQPMRQGRLHTGSWTVECSRQRIDRDWDIVTRFCNILHACNLMASKFESSQILRSRGNAGAAASSPEIFGPSM